MAQLKAELARLREQKEKILRSPLEAITATSFAGAPPPIPSAILRGRGGGGGGGGGGGDADDVDQQIRAGLDQIRANAQQSLDTMWGSPFQQRQQQREREREQQQQQQQQRQPPPQQQYGGAGARGRQQPAFGGGGGRLGGGGAGAGGGRQPYSAASEIPIQSAEELYNYVQQAQRASGLS